MSESALASNRIYRTPRPQDLSQMSTSEVRETFLVPDLFQPGKINLVFTDLDRLVVGGAVPLANAIVLPNSHETGRRFFLEARELGSINIGGPGAVVVDGNAFDVQTEGCIYIGKGVEKVEFSSLDPANPAKFYILSCPAHAAFQTTVARREDANTIPIGSLAQSNQRVIRQFIHEKGIKSCQLVMGYTELAEGSVWNSFPPHTHARRTEIYMYFALEQRVLAHFLGEPSATRHVFVHEGEAVLSPAWSIHCGCGQGNYKFVWGMAGENQRFDDMDGTSVLELK